MKKRKVILRGVVPAAIVLLIFAASVLVAQEINVSITPQTLSLTKGNPTWLLCYTSLPDPNNARDVKECTLEIEGVTETIDADKVGCKQSKDGDVVAFFDCDNLKDLLPKINEEVELELTLTVELEDGTIFVESDTITVRP